MTQIIPSRPCPACSSTDRTSRGDKNGYQLNGCRACLTLYTATVPCRPGEEYDDHYINAQATRTGYAHRRLDEIVASFSPYRRNNRLCDVGFGAAFLMDAARRGGWAVEGVETSRSAVAHARGLGFDVFHETLAGARYPADSFDVVTAVEVLEHVPDPALLIEEVARVLRPGGLFWATTPHGRGVSARLLGADWKCVCPPEHLQLLSVAGIKTLLKGRGFHRIKVSSQGVNPFELLQVLRAPEASEADPGAHARTPSNADLNEAMAKSGVRLALKGMVNTFLDVFGLGDALKI